MSDRIDESRARERGFALVLALLSLMLLTFLGLTLAATSTTEMQIAANYRSGMQALHNAKAGLDVSRLVLSDLYSPGAGWTAVLPPARTGTWARHKPGDPFPGSIPVPGLYAPGYRDFEMQSCDETMYMGYGLVLTTPLGVRLENVSNYLGYPLIGGFTVWVRRPPEVGKDGMYYDSVKSDVVVVVSEGTAPYVSESNYALTRQSTRILEERYHPASLEPVCMDPSAGQIGQGQAGDNFNPCGVSPKQADNGVAGESIAPDIEESLGP